MKFISFALALLALVTGLVAAARWYKASKVEIMPLWAELGVIEPLGGSSNHWIVGILKAAQKSGALNKEAALWTASSVFLSALSAVIGAWPISN